jgi:hypothetical protein
MDAADRVSSRISGRVWPAHEDSFAGKLAGAPLPG